MERWRDDGFRTGDETDITLITLITLREGLMIVEFHVMEHE
jgi:hypothetical protein